jgi:hypothetical protein
MNDENRKKNKVKKIKKIDRLSILTLYFKNLSNSKVDIRKGTRIRISK